MYVDKKLYFLKINEDTKSKPGYTQFTLSCAAMLIYTSYEGGYVRTPDFRWEVRGGGMAAVRLPIFCAKRNALPIRFPILDTFGGAEWHGTCKL